ncbi:hypothetical protein CFAEC_01350 [Corynebacterium faecale]|nr:hypothetical protein CFAEC_01350 [Corynebacterium faecale]
MYMSVAAHVLTLKRISAESPALKLLSSAHAPVILAIIREYFGEGVQRRPAAELYENMVQDFRMIRDDIELARTPQQYINDWVKAGYFLRSAGTTSSGEMIEPSEDALYAMDVASRLSAPRSTATASRIESLSASLQVLARDTDPDISSRLLRLERERDLLEEQIARVSRGDFDLLSPAQVKERVNDILDAAAGVPADFTRVRQELEELNRSLRRQLLDPEGTRGAVLEQIFQGVDLISESDAGKSFTGFYAVLIDQEKSAYIDDWIEHILSRAESHALTPDERMRIRRLFRDFEQGGYEVNLMMTNLARSLRHYVTSEQFNEDRRMVELLRETRGLAADAVAASNLSPLARMTTPLVRIGMQVSSISALRLKNPGEEFVEDEPTIIEPEEPDIQALLDMVRESEIDMEELMDAVRSGVDKHGTCTVGTILTDHPATQGLASVVGLQYLGLMHGLPTEHNETVTWDEDGTPRAARITGRYFDSTSIREM